MEGIPKKAQRRNEESPDAGPETLLGGKFERGQEITVQLNSLSSVSEIGERPFRYSASTLDDAQLCYVTTDENLGVSIDGKAKVKITDFDDAIGAFEAEFISLEEMQLVAEKNQLEQQTFEKGQIVQGVRFENKGDGKLTSSLRGRKAFLISGDSLQTYLAETGAFSLSDNEFTVRVLRDTKPGKKDGVIVVELLGTDSEIMDNGTLRTPRLPSTPRRPLRNTDNPFAGLAELGRKQREQLERPRVVNNELDFSKYTPEQLQNVEGIERGVILRNVPFRAGEYIDSRGQTTVSPTLINGKQLATFSDLQFDVPGVYDVEIDRVYDFIYLVLQSPKTSPEDLEDRSIKTVTLQESDLALVPNHENLLRSQAARLRQPELQTALQLSHQAMDEYSGAKEILNRAKDMRTGAAEGEKHRHFTPLAAAIFKDQKSQRLFNAGIDTLVDHKSTEMRNWLETWDEPEPPLLPAIVIGTGPHGATFLSTYAMYASEAPALAVDSSGRIGGQFAAAEKPVFRLNSRNRPQMEGENRNDRNLPGTEQTINPLGTMATLQVSDLSGESYVTQDVLANATRFNTITATDNFLTECTLISNETVTRFDGTNVARCTFIDTNRNQLCTIDTDNLVIAGGIGKDAFRFSEADEFTASLLRRETEKIAQGIRPAVMSFPQMISFWGSSSNPSPLRGVKTAAISGSGDSANVAAGIILGYEPGADRMPVALDRVDTLYWIGQSIPTKEEWLTSVRARYAQVGLELPRDIEGYYSRIVPIPNNKVEDIEILSYSTSKPDRVRLSQTNASDLSVDLYVACNGFSNEVPNVLNGANPNSRIEGSFSRSSELPQDFFQPGSYIKTANSESIRILSSVPGSSNSTKTIKFIVTDKNKNIIEESTFTNEPVRYLENVIKDQINSWLRSDSSTKLTYSIPDVDVPVSYETIFDKDGFPVGKRVLDTNTILVGPTADLAVTEQEKEVAPVLNTIPENTAALFRYGRGTEVSAQYVAKRTTGENKERYDYPSGRPALAVKASRDKRFVTTDMTIGNRTENNNYHVKNIQALQLALAEHIALLRLSANVPELAISCTVEPYDTGVQQVSFALEGVTLDGSSERVDQDPLNKLLNSIATDPAIQTAIKNEIIVHRGALRGTDSMRSFEVNQGLKKVNTNLPAGQKISAPVVPNTVSSTLTITIPVKKATTDVLGLTLAWSDA